jgi:hypothetical protein
MVSSDRSTARYNSVPAACQSPWSMTSGCRHISCERRPAPSSSQCVPRPVMTPPPLLLSSQVPQRPGSLRAEHRSTKGHLKAKVQGGRRAPWPQTPCSDRASSRSYTRKPAVLDKWAQHHSSAARRCPHFHPSLHFIVGIPSCKRAPRRIRPCLLYFDCRPAAMHRTRQR